jgi:hypothetical protein
MQSDGVNSSRSFLDVCRIGVSDCLCIITLVTFHRLDTELCPGKLPEASSCLAFCSNKSYLCLNPIVNSCSFPPSCTLYSASFRNPVPAAAVVPGFDRFCLGHAGRMAASHGSDRSCTRSHHPGYATTGYQRRFLLPLLSIYMIESLITQCYSCICCGTVDHFPVCRGDLLCLLGAYICPQKQRCG